MEDQFYDIVCEATALLRQHLGYRQITVVHKLAALGCVLSTSSFSHIIRRDKRPGLELLAKTAKGMEALLLRELGLQYDAQAQTFIRLDESHWKPYPVPEVSRAPRHIIFHEYGRVPVETKTGFIRGAQEEVIEVGIRLNTFTNNFISQNEEAYRGHILALLQRGVTVKGYLLDPDSQEARLYFDDRTRAQNSEKNGINSIKNIIEQLRGIAAELNTADLPGKFEIYQYKHVPFAFFYAVDGHLEHGKMMVAPYLYGIRRANCPVMEFHKKDHPILFKRYWESLRSFIQDAKQLI